jgi:hypothetical protein
MDAPKVGADTFVEIGFTSGAGSLAAGGAPPFKPVLPKMIGPTIPKPMITA